MVQSWNSRFELPVSSLEEQVVAGDGLGLASLGDHLQLRHDGDGFEVDRKSPQELGDVEVVVDEEGHADSRDENELDSESERAKMKSLSPSCRLLVAFFVVGRAEFRVDEEAGHEGAEQVGHFHEGVVRTDEDGEQIQVTSHENKEEQHLKSSFSSGTTVDSHCGIKNFQKKNFSSFVFI